MPPNTKIEPPEKKNLEPATATKHENKKKLEKIVPARGRRKSAPMHTFICESGKNALGELIFKVRSTFPKALSEAEIVKEIETLGPENYVVIKGRIIPASFTTKTVNAITLGGTTG